MTDVRACRQDCFDRLVLDDAGRNEGFSVRYVTAITGLGLARAVDLCGGALLEILVGEPNGSDTDHR